MDLFWTDTYKIKHRPILVGQQYSQEVKHA
jgi:hypothetical protein